MNNDETFTIDPLDMDIAREARYGGPTDDYTWDRVALAILTALVEAGRLPDASESRSWSLPAEPGPEVTHLRDDSGQLWERDDIGQQWTTVTDDPAKFWVKAYSDWADFLEGYGPLVAASPLSEEKGA